MLDAGVGAGQAEAVNQITDRRMRMAKRVEELILLLILVAVLICIIPSSHERRDGETVDEYLERINNMKNFWRK